MLTPADKTAQIRDLMKTRGIDAYVIPLSDPHISENVSDHWRVVEWLTGFTGSAATVVITDIFAGLWTDSRYFIQAEKQLQGSGFLLIRPHQPGDTDLISWLYHGLEPGGRIGVDGRTFSIARLRKFKSSLADKGISFDIQCDLISGLWKERPQLPDSVAFDHHVRFCGKERSLKIAEVRMEMRSDGVSYQLLTALDDIMWLFNIRGKDIRYNPLIYSFAIIGEDRIFLFTREGKIPPDLAASLENLGTEILPYEDVSDVISSFPAHKSIMISTPTTSAILFNSIPDGMRIVEKASIPARMKAVKNKTEIGNIGKVMVRDGVALTRFFHWFEKNHDSIIASEILLTEKLDDFRSAGDNYLGPSFATIMAYNDHAAVPHYSATPPTDAIIGAGGILLVDSGGQYLDGTTDITRTIAIGRPSERQIKDFTLVLKGTIALADVKFPEGTKGYQLDILARKALWDNGLNYGHGTGHGVGFCLNVHEGPHGISPGAESSGNTILVPGMIVSDEPAVYRENEYGIRTENLVLCYSDEETEYGRFLRFDTLSLCYIDKSLIDINLIDKREADWLNSYHATVYEKLSPFLTEEEKIWLREKTGQL
jgi:Xaa-Pro aminopeptidase